MPEDIKPVLTEAQIIEATGSGSRSLPPYLLAFARAVERAAVLADREGRQQREIHVSTAALALLTAGGFVSEEKVLEAIRIARDTPSIEQIAASDGAPADAQRAKEE